MPVEQIAGQYQATPQTFSDGTIAVQVDPQGNIKTVGAGSAGTPSAGVQSVQGIDGMVPIDTVAVDATTGDPLDTAGPFPVYSAPPAGKWSYTAPSGGLVNTTTAVTIRAAQPGLVNYVTAMQVDTAVLTTASELVIRDGAGGTVIWRGYLKTGAQSLNLTFNPAISGSLNTLLEVATLTATGAALPIYINIQGLSE